MDFKALLRRKNPISLKWKWGVLLFLGFFTVGITGLVVYHLHFRTAQRETLTTIYQAEFDSTVRYLENFQTIFQYEVPNDMETTLQHSDALRSVLVKEVYDYLSVQEDDTVLIRLFNVNNQLIYATRHIQLPKMNLSRDLTPLNLNGTLLFVASSELYAKNTGEKLGTVQYIIQANQFFEREYGQLRTFLIAVLLLIIIAALLAILVSRQFLRPLNYLNNALDLVEEESLSEIRMRKPKTVDEWSDLTLHINRMLDKIDLYVKNQKQFVEDVSHELRTPVAIVEGHLTMLNRWGKDDPEILEESIQASLQEIIRMKGLVQEMLDLMRADHAEVDYKDEITEVFSTTRQVFNNFVMLYPEFNFYLDADKNTADLYIRMFRNHFEQILIILLDNAVKYSTTRKEIHVSVSQTLSEIEIAVQDFGEGMTEENKNRVFGRFYRVDKARSRDKGGNGLGLSIAQQLVQSYKGAIRVESVLDHGSIFYVNFPILTDTRQIYKSKQIEKEKNL